MTCVTAALTTAAGGIAAGINRNQNPIVSSISAISGLLPWLFIGSMFFNFDLPQALAVIGLYLPAPAFLMAIVGLATSDRKAAQKATMLALVAGLCMGLLFTLTMFDLLCQM